MIRAFWFLIKVIVLVGVVAWIAERPGTITMEWLNYRLEMHVGLFLLMALAVILLSIFIYQVIKAFVDFPASYRRYRKIRGQQKGYRAVTLGLTAVAAGDTETASRQAAKAKHYMPDDTGLALLLQAQAARLQGKEAQALEHFTALLENKETSFLGVRGLLQAALDQGNHHQALALARRALDLHPKQPWLLKLVYELELKSRHWKDAQSLLKRLERSGTIEKEKARSDRIAMFLAEGDQEREGGYLVRALELYKKAFRLDPGFSPSALRYARLQNQNGKRRAAQRILENAWKAGPHPDLVEDWMALKPQKANNPLERMRWIERLVKSNPDHSESYLAVAKIALEQKLRGEAQDYLQKAKSKMEQEEGVADARVARLEAMLKNQIPGNFLEEKKQELQDLETTMAEEAHPEKKWICEMTGRIYEAWQPIALPHGSFNTIVWKHPRIASSEILSEILGYERTFSKEAILETPKKLA